MSLGAAVWASVSRTLTSAEAPTAEDITAQVLAALNATAIPVNTVQIKGQTIAGAGTEADPWGP